MVPLPHDGVAALDRAGRVCHKLARDRRPRRSDHARAGLYRRALCHVAADAGKEDVAEATLADEVCHITR